MRSFKHEDEFSYDDSMEDNCSCPSSSDENEEHIGDHKKSGLYTVDRTKRLKASARERRRRHVLNDALERLRRKVPCLGQRSTKLSKIEVLRMAIDYIAMLSGYLNYSSPPPFFNDESNFGAFTTTSDNNNNNTNNISFGPILQEMTLNHWNGEYDNNQVFPHQVMIKFINS